MLLHCCNWVMWLCLHACCQCLLYSQQRRLWLSHTLSCWGHSYNCYSLQWRLAWITSGHACSPVLIICWNFLDRVPSGRFWITCEILKTRTRQLGDLFGLPVVVSQDKRSYLDYLRLWALSGPAREWSFGLPVKVPSGSVQGVVHKGKTHSDQLFGLPQQGTIGLPRQGRRGSCLDYHFTLPLWQTTLIETLAGVSWPALSHKQGVWLDSE